MPRQAMWRIAKPGFDPQQEILSGLLLSQLSNRFLTFNRKYAILLIPDFNFTLLVSPEPEVV
jgi:hypothetical protein